MSEHLPMERFDEHARRAPSGRLWMREIEKPSRLAADLVAAGLEVAACKRMQVHRRPLKYGPSMH